MLSVDHNTSDIIQGTRVQTKKMTTAKRTPSDVTSLVLCWWLCDVRRFAHRNRLALVAHTHTHTSCRNSLSACLFIVVESKMIAALTLIQLSNTIKANANTTFGLHSAQRAFVCNLRIASIGNRSTNNVKQTKASKRSRRKSPCV